MTDLPAPFRVWMISGKSAVPIASPKTYPEALEIFRGGAAACVSSCGRVLIARGTLSPTETAILKKAIDSDDGAPAVGALERAKRVIAAQNLSVMPRCANHGCPRAPSPARRDLLCETCGAWE